MKYEREPMEMGEDSGQSKQNLDKYPTVSPTENPNLKKYIHPQRHQKERRVIWWGRPTNRDQEDAVCGVHMRKAHMINMYEILYNPLFLILNFPSRPDYP